MLALLVFIMATLEIVFGRKKKLTSDGRGNVFINPARYAILYFSILILIVVAIILFLDSYVNYPCWPRSHLQNSKELLP